MAHKKNAAPFCEMRIEEMRAFRKAFPGAIKTAGKEARSFATDMGYPLIGGMPGQRFMALYTWVKDNPIIERKAA
ncbi:MAG: hypothetical protein COY40_03965 [Alphaproteobacteria bacterium CG_4_10_14_0_8_um_filter_53_9]|nr:MAG: hypothetical protein COY40_03965 [Alphaproteobacteria bacterium CG_4_10_14_0_8_um_filter_53_9]